MNKKMKIRKMTLIGYKKIVELFETKKVNKDNTISFDISDIKKMPIICTDILYQLDEKKMYKEVDKFLDRKNKKKISLDLYYPKTK